MNLIYELNIRDGKSLPDFTGSDAHYVFLTLNCKVLDEKTALLFKKLSDTQLMDMTTDDYVVIDALLHQRKITEKYK